jgi:hypothetical protein
MEKYYLVLLKRTPNAPKMEEPALEKLQKQHLGHLRAMYGGEDGHRRSLRRATGPDDAWNVPLPRGLAGGGTSACRGRPDGEGGTAPLQVDVLAWWVEKGYLSFKALPASK